jgi:hypothetical protein
MATRALLSAAESCGTAHEQVHFQIGVRGSAQECGPEVRSGGSIEPETAAWRRRGECARLDLRFAIDSAIAVFIAAAPAAAGRADGVFGMPSRARLYLVQAKCAQSGEEHCKRNNTQARTRSMEIARAGAQPRGRPTQDIHVPTAKIRTRQGR